MTQGLSQPHPAERYAGLDLSRHRDFPAVVAGDRVLSYADLDALVRARADQLGSTRRLVVIECANQLEPLITYLAALRGRHPAMLVPALGSASPEQRRQWRRVIDGYGPDVSLALDGAGSWTLSEARPGTRHDLHPDLAVLLGTSGSTGSPKMVRLSARNIEANATAVAGYLGLGPHSRAATTLPMQFGYGLSVIHSHLLSGGSVWLTDASVAEPGFFDAFDAAGATTFSGVPYTFELLERVGERWWDRPHLRQVTVSGGRLAPDKVRTIARACAQHGVELFVMYGQTEATSRIAYLPAHLAEHRPDCIGIPIECGDIRIVGGELVYTGDNVMLGYAEQPSDLALGRTIQELHTGDLAVEHDDGIFQIVGRCNRVAKVLGNRVDLDLVEQLLESQGIASLVVARTDQLDVFVLDAERSPGPGEVAHVVSAELALPPQTIAVSRVPDFPRTLVGKPDRAALPELPGPSVRADSVAETFAVVLGRSVSPDDSFVSLGGDSLSFIELYVRLERILGALPDDWQERSVAELSGLPGRARRFTAVLETPVVLRFLAIVFIVGSHIGLFRIKGGAHVLLALVGYNVARFVLAAPDIRSRLRSLGRLARELAVPSVLWIGAVAVHSGTYDWHTVLLVNNVFGTPQDFVQWNYWFVEAALWSAVAIGLLACLPWVERLAREHPFATPLVALAVALVVRYAQGDPTTNPVSTYEIATTAWLAMLGWAIAGARTLPQRLFATALVPVLVRGFAPTDRPREYAIMIGLALLIWVPRVVVPRILAPTISAVGSASLFIYLTHVQIHPHFGTPLTGWRAAGVLVICLAAGVVAWRAYTWVQRRVIRHVGGGAEPVPSVI